MNIRIRISSATVKALLEALGKGYKSGDSRRVKRISVLLEFSGGDSPRVIANKHGVGISTIYAWLKALLTDGLSSLKSQWRGGRPRKLTGTQRQQLRQWLQAGPQAAGYPGDCWSALLVQDLIQRAFGMLYNAHRSATHCRHQRQTQRR